MVIKYKIIIIILKMSQSASVLSKRARGSYDPYYVSSQGVMANSARRAKKVRQRKAVSKKRRDIATKEYVKRILDNRIEKKQICIEQSQSFGSIQESNDMNMFPMCPYTGLFTIPIGTTDGTRVGNEIRIRKVTLRYVLRTMQYQNGVNDNPQPVHVQFFLGYTNVAPGVLPTSADLQTLFQSGSSSFAPDGSLSDLISVINDDYWTIKKSWIDKLGTAVFSGPGNLQNYGFFANNDFPLSVVKSLDITALCPKKIKFNDSAAISQGPNLFLFYQAVNTTGTSGGATQRPAGIDYWVDFEYEDA